GVKTEYEASGKFPTKYDLTARFKGKGGDSVPATTVQCLADRLSKALKRFLDRKELSGKEGFPRFKSALQWHSIHLRHVQLGRDAWIEGGHLRVPAKLGRSLKVKQHRPLEGTPKTAHLVLRADGHWYALIACDVPPEPTEPTEAPKEAVGIDVGLKVFLAD